MKRIARTIALFIGLMAVSPISHGQEHNNATINDKEISVVDFQEMRYPPLALQTRIQGLVVVQVKLNNDGGVVDASAISGSELLIPDCLTNIRKWKFQPNAHHAAVVVYNFKLLYTAGCKSAGSFFTLEAPNLVTITDCPRTIQP